MRKEMTLKVLRGQWNQNDQKKKKDDGCPSHPLTPRKPLVVVKRTNNEKQGRSKRNREKTGDLFSKG